MCAALFIQSIGKSCWLALLNCWMLYILDPFRDGDEDFSSEEAKALYDEVFYFIDKRRLKLPDKELVEVLKESNSDRFD